ncbi:hypothetical protein GCM10027193_11800 [Arenimonas aestuarii]
MAGGTQALGQDADARGFHAIVIAYQYVHQESRGKNPNDSGCTARGITLTCAGVTFVHGQAQATHFGYRG